MDNFWIFYFIWVPCHDARIHSVQSLLQWLYIVYVQKKEKQQLQYATLFLFVL